MEAFLLSATVVALAEIGDKTQLLAFVLAARFRAAVPIILGILVATLANHCLAGGVGAWVGAAMPPATLRLVLGLSFVAMGAWILIPDSLDEHDAKLARLGAFGTTVVAFFLAEMGDKTQIATVALAAQYRALTAVVLGTTLGMLVANVPAVLLGERLGERKWVRWVHAAAAAVFVMLGIATLLGYGEGLGV